MATVSDFSLDVRYLESCARESIDRAERREQEFDTAKTEATLVTPTRGHLVNRRPKLTAKIRVVNGFVRFNIAATRWLPVWMDTQLSFKEHHN
jgi:hypothetical protein